jgi:hypothetical protein
MHDQLMIAAADGRTSAIRMVEREMRVVEVERLAISFQTRYLTG